jgi:mono/diheme cytochrome c family protein
MDCVGNMRSVTRHIYFSAATLLMAAVLPADAASTAISGDPQTGHRLAKMECGSCHAIEKGQLQSPHAEAPTFVTVATTPGMTRRAIGVALKTSHKTMPNLILNKHEIADLAAYILSLR